jgi:protein-S-isoprenylcysteine O-methyltransferase Ste14
MRSGEVRDRSDEGAGVRFPPPLLYVAFLGLGLIASARYPVHLLRSTMARPLGGALLASGVVVGPIWGIRTLRRAGTTVRPDKPTATLVTDGPFRLSRNPLYLALTLIYVGIAFIANSLWALLMLFPVTLIMSRFVIRREEEYLARTFGEEYERYRINVRRWI